MSRLSFQSANSWVYALILATMPKLPVCKCGAEMLSDDCPVCLRVAEGKR